MIRSIHQSLFCLLRASGRLERGSCKKFLSILDLNWNKMDALDYPNGRNDPEITWYCQKTQGITSDTNDIKRNNIICGIFGNLEDKLATALGPVVKEVAPLKIGDVKVEYLPVILSKITMIMLEVERLTDRY